jgi:hypothetical protein
MHAFVCCICTAVAVAAMSSPPDPAEWSSDHVLEWLGDNELHALRPTSEALAMDGVVLLHLEEQDLRDEFGLRSMHDRERVMQKVHELRPSGGGESKRPLPQRTFAQYRTMKRRTTDVHMMLLVTYPRVGLLLMDDAYDARQMHRTDGGHEFGQALTNPDDDAFPVRGGRLAWAVLSPHTFIALHRGDFFGGLPWWYVTCLWLGAVGELVMLAEFCVMCCFPAMVQTAIMLRVAIPLLQLVALVVYYLMHTVLPIWFLDICFVATLLGYALYTAFTLFVPCVVCAYCDARRDRKRHRH